MRYYLLHIFAVILVITGFQYSANATTSHSNNPAVNTGFVKPRIVINIPARRLRVYKGRKCILDCPTAVGRYNYPGIKHNTKTRVGSYHIRKWVKDYTNRQYPLKWSKNNWRGAFGQFAAMLSPRSAGQHIHGTIGPVELEDFYLKRMPPEAKSPDESISHYERYIASYEYGLSHGCTRLSNKNIEKLRKLCPPGTKVEKIYCLHEQFETKNPWEIKDVYYPDIYRYKVSYNGTFFPETGELKNYSQPEAAVSYR